MKTKRWARAVVFCLGFGTVSPSNAAVTVVSSAQQVAVMSSSVVGARSYAVGDVIFDAPLRWSEAAMIEEDRQVTVGDRSVAIRATAPLPSTDLRFDSGGPDIRAYCSPRRAAERELDHGMAGALFGGVLTRKLVKAATDAQTCLFDSDGDGKLDKAVMINAGAQSGITFSLPPVPFRIERMMPIGSGDGVTLRYRGLAIGTTSPGFELIILQQGEKRAFTRIDYGTAVQPKHIERITYLSSKSGFPIKADILNLQFQIDTLDQITKIITVDWSGGGERAPSMIIPDGVRFIAGGY